MEIKIGVRNVAREVVVESSQSADEVTALVDQAIAGNGPLRLTDEKGRVVVVPSEGIGYVEIGAPERRGVGFGSL